MIAERVQGLIKMRNKNELKRVKRKTYGAKKR